MLDKQKHSISVLNEVVNVMEDGNKGYKDAAEKVEDNELRTMFNLYAQQRTEFSAELQHEIRELGGEPKDTDDLKGKLHRAWVDLKAAVAGNDKNAILNECENGDTAALKEIEEALKQDIPQFLKDKLKKQHTEIQNNIKQLNKLKV